MAYAGKSGEAVRLHSVPNARSPRGLTRASERPSRTAVLSTGIAIGLLVGAGMAMLLAPREGWETRRAFGRRMRRVGRRGRDVWDDLRDELRRARRHVRRARRMRQVDLDDRRDADVD